MAAFLIGDRIKEAREAKGLSASEFARRSGVTPTCVWNWERGATNPRRNAVVAICKALDLEQQFLLAGVVRPTSETPDLKIKPKNIDGILDVAASDIAVALGVTKDRIKVRFEVSQN